MATAKKSKQIAATKHATIKNAPKPAIVVATPSGQRRIKVPKRKILRRQDKRFKARPKLPSALTIANKAGRLLIKNWRVIGGMVLLYGIFNIILVRGLNGGANVSDLKSQVDAFFQGTSGQLISGLTVFGLLLTSSNDAASAEASAYQSFLLIITSLALVWSYRELLAGVHIRIRDGFYHGMAPLIPVVLVLFVIGLECIPLFVGSWLYATIVQSGIAVSGVEQLATVLVALVFCFITIYLLCSTLFALYIVALPDMTPMRAMRSARELVRYRRWPVIRKLLFLPLLLIVIFGAAMLPCILFVAVVAQWLFFVLTTFTIAVVHAYMYVLYRELLNE